MWCVACLDRLHPCLLNVPALDTPLPSPQVPFLIQADPNETTDPGTDPAHQQRVAALGRLLVETGRNGPVPAPGSDGGATSDAECAIVQATGAWQPWE